MTVSLIYLTCPGVIEAQKIAKAVVEDRLAACANILPGMQSVFHWDGKIETADECVVILKTRSSLFPALEERVRALHSYKNPCIVALAPEAGSNPFFDWVMAETKP